MDSLELGRTWEGAIELGRGSDPLDPKGATEPHPMAEEREPLSRIIEELNDRFGVGLTERDRLSLESLAQQLSEDPALEAAVRSNTRENVRLSFEEKAKDLFQDTARSNFDFYKRVTDDEEFGRRLFDLLFEEFWRRRGE